MGNGIHPLLKFTCCGSLNVCLLDVTFEYACTEFLQLLKGGQGVRPHKYDMGTPLTLRIS